jgi:hypothetical protein
MNRFGIRHIAAMILLAIFFVKGMAGIVSLFSSQLDGQALIELVHSSEQEENKSIPESKAEGEPNEYFIAHASGALHIYFAQFVKELPIRGSTGLRPGFSSVATPPPDQA